MLWFLKKRASNGSIDTHLLRIIVIAGPGIRSRWVSVAHVLKNRKLGLLYCTLMD